MSTLRASTGAQYARIMGIGGYRPRRVVDNAEICTYIAVSYTHLTLPTICSV